MDYRAFSLFYPTASCLSTAILPLTQLSPEPAMPRGIPKDYDKEIAELEASIKAKKQKAKDDAAALKIAKDKKAARAAFQLKEENEALGTIARILMQEDSRLRDRLEAEVAKVSDDKTAKALARMFPATPAPVRPKLVTDEPPQPEAGSTQDPWSEPKVVVG